MLGYFCRFLEDFVSIKIRRWQKGAATRFDYSLLGRVHRIVLTRLSSIPSEANASPPLAVTGVGLHNSRVAVEAPNPAWGNMADTESRRIRGHFEPLTVTIHHIGSTSVPGLPAKPIIDLAVGFDQQVLETRLPEIISRMQNSGYRYLGDWKKRGGYFFEKADGQVRTHAVQVHRRDSDDLRRLLRFRDLMRSDPRLVRRYAELKIFLARVLAHHRGLYFWYKSHWLNDLLLEHRGPNAWGEWWVSARYPTMIQFIQRSIIRTLSGGRLGRHPMAV